MCGRYYVDDETAKEIEKIVRKIDGRLHGTDGFRIDAGDVCPSAAAPVLISARGGLDCQKFRWGLSGFDKKQLIFNARSESALEKRIFRESVERRRAVVPAAWFYEWNSNKEKNTFYEPGQPVLYMAGFYERCQDGERFVILTTAANDSMRPVHDRMPLLLEREEIEDWLLDDSLTPKFLEKTPSHLERRAEYEQMSLFPMENSL